MNVSLSDLSLLGTQTRYPYVCRTGIVLARWLPHLTQGVESCSQKSRLGLSIFPFLLSGEHGTAGMIGPVQPPLLDVHHKYLKKAVRP